MARDPQEQLGEAVTGIQKPGINHTVSRVVSKSDPRPSFVSWQSCAGTDLSRAVSLGESARGKNQMSFPAPLQLPPREAEKHMRLMWEGR